MLESELEGVRGLLAYLVHLVTSVCPVHKSPSPACDSLSSCQEEELEVGGWQKIVHKKLNLAGHGGIHL